jgi:hypothetical protein
MVVGKIVFLGDYHEKSVLHVHLIDGPSTRIVAGLTTRCYLVMTPEKSCGV